MRHFRLEYILLYLHRISVFTQNLGQTPLPLKENWTYRRGDIYLANLNPYIGSEQGGTRPVLLLQNNTGNFYCPTLIVAPLTARRGKKPHQPTHYLLSSVKGMDGASVVLLEQIKTIDKRRVVRYIGRVSRE